MTIAEVREKCKSLVGRVPRDILTIGILILASVFSFGFGFLAGKDAAGQGSTIQEKAPIADSAKSTEVVASKNGTKYYFPDCAGAQRISEANKVQFASATAAAQAGYTLAANCAGQ